MKKITFFIISIFLTSFVFLVNPITIFAQSCNLPNQCLSLPECLSAGGQYDSGEEKCGPALVCCMPSETTTESEIYNPALDGFGTGAGETIIAQIIANALKIVFSVSGLILLIMLLIGGFQWMTAGGNKEAMAAAQKRITSALVGFVIFISIFAIINFIAPVLGLGFLQILRIEWPTP